jgi:hypothetical protein
VGCWSVRLAIVLELSVCVCVYASATLWTWFVIIVTPWCCKFNSELLVKCNVWCIYVEWHDLGCKRVGLKSFMVLIDYQDYMGSSSKIWAFRCLFLYLCSYNLVGSVTVCSLDYFVCCISMYSYICIIAPHLGTLAKIREGPNVEQNQKMVFGGSIPKMEGSDKC